MGLFFVNKSLTDYPEATVVVADVVVTDVFVNVLVVGLPVVADHIIFCCGHNLRLLRGSVEIVLGGGVGVVCKVIVMSNYC